MPRTGLETQARPVGGCEDLPAYELIESFFFAYRDFVADADRILLEYGFGRAHHRVLHFVARRPGMTVAGLLDVLRITKQSLNRVLKELVEKSFIRQEEGRDDRRRRLLHPTEAGRDLAVRLARLQTRRIGAALAACDGCAGRDAARRFLLAVMDPRNGPGVQDGAGPATIGP